jgi:hypothetical protein
MPDGKPSFTATHRGHRGAVVIGPLRIDVPRDRDGGFDPLQMPKHERHFAVFEEKRCVGGRIDFEHARLTSITLGTASKAPRQIAGNGFEDAE